MVESHIVPKSFHRAMQDDPGNAGVRLYDPTKQRTKKLPGGHYDQHLLCHDCETRFGPWDAYGAECLIHNFSRDALTVYAANGQPYEYRVQKWDEKKFRMFALSVLWRAAVTKLDHFKNVTLGATEKRLRRLILMGDPGSPDEFSVRLMRFHTLRNRPEVLKMGLPPAPWRLDNKEIMNLYFGGGVITIKTDEEPYSFQERSRMVQPGFPIYFAALNVDDTPFMQMLAEALTQAKKPRGRR